MPAGELFERVGDFTAGGPRLDAPFAAPDRDPVHVASTLTDEVMHEVMVRPPPHGGIHLESQMRETRGRDQSAISDVAGEAQRFGSENQPANGRVNAIGADAQVSVGG